MRSTTTFAMNMTVLASRPIRNIASRTTVGTQRIVESEHPPVRVVVDAGDHGEHGHGESERHAFGMRRAEATDDAKHELADQRQLEHAQEPVLQAVVDAAEQAEEQAAHTHQRGRLRLNGNWLRAAA